MSAKSSSKGGKSTSKGKSIVCEGREKASTEATLNHEDGDQEEIRKEEERATTAKKKEGRLEKKFQSVEDVDAEIARLKAPPRTLTREDFKQEYGLPDVGDNPYCFRKNTVRPEALKNLFGVRYGDCG